MSGRRTFDPQEARSTPPVYDREDRACRGVDLELFFPEHSSGYAAAIAVCETCPHEADCLAWALETRQCFGVLGGKSPEDRRRILARTH